MITRKMGKIVVWPLKVIRFVPFPQFIIKPAADRKRAVSTSQGRDLLAIAVQTNHFFCLFRLFRFAFRCSELSAHKLSLWRWPHLVAHVFLQPPSALLFGGSVTSKTAGPDTPPTLGPRATLEQATGWWAFTSRPSAVHPKRTVNRKSIEIQCFPHAIALIMRAVALLDPPLGRCVSVGIT